MPTAKRKKAASPAGAAPPSPTKAARTSSAPAPAATVSNDSVPPAVAVAVPSAGPSGNGGGSSSHASPFPPPAVARRRPAAAAGTAPRRLPMQYYATAPPSGGYAPPSVASVAGVTGPSEYSNMSLYSNASTASSAPRSADAIDDVMNEVDHLLQAAAEAQALGRLRNAYSMMLLAHQRLVGVGRRVDRSYCEAEDDAAAGKDKGEASNEASNLSMESKQPAFLPPLVSQPPLPPNMTHDYSDVAYVEHLARSAMELHHRRTGRGMQHDLALERLAHQKRTKQLEEEHLRNATGALMGMKKGKPRVEDVSPATKRRGGRGKKPPTLVMHTMAGKNYDVKELMRGVL